MKIKQLLLAAAAMVFAVACNEVPEEPVNPTPEVQVSVLPNTLSVAYTGAENSVLVNAKGAWTATADAEWIKVEPASGEAGAVQVKVTVEKSTVSEARTGKVVFAVGEEKAELAVEQQAAPEAGSEVWGIAGSHQEWAPADAPVMEFADGYYFQKGMELAAGTEFKFVKDNAWDVNRGYNGSKPMTANYYYAVEHNGGNIKVTADGTYDVYLNADATVFYLMEAGKLPAEAQDSETLEDAEVDEAAKGLRVVGTHNGWNKDGDDVNMTLENGLYAAKEVKFEKPADADFAEFKFVQDRDWNKAYGVEDGTEIAANHCYAVGGSNIKVAAGTYDLYLSEDATKFYVMAVGVDPSEAEDATGGAGAEATATITIREEETTESYIAFNITTENVVAASYGVLESEFVDETITAEYILSEGGYALPEDEINTTIEMGYRRGVTAGTDYTIFVAYEDEAGNKAMVTATVTTPGAAATTYYVMATSVDVFYDDLYGESMVTFFGEEQDMVVYINTEVSANTDYFFVVEPGEKGVTYAEVRDHETRNTLAELGAGYGSFSIYSAGDGLYMAMADFSDDSGLSMGAVYEGAVEGLGGGGAAGGTQEITFAVASATVAHHAEYPGDNSIWELVLTNANGDNIGLAIETGYDDAPCIVSGTYDVTTAPDLAGNVGVWVYSWFQFGNSYYSMYDPEISFLSVESAYPDQDINVFNGMFVVMDYMTGNAANIYITTPTPIAIYGNMEPSEPSVFEWAFDGNLSAKALIDTEFGESDIRIYNNDEGLYVQVVVNTTDLVDKDFYFQGEAFGATEWITSACVKKADTHEVVTTLTDLEFSIYQNFYTDDPGFYIGCYGDTNDGGYIGVDYIGLIDGLELPSAEVEEKIFVIASATAVRSEDYPDDDSVWYVELTSTTGDVVGFTFDQVYGAAQGANFFVGGGYQVATYITGEMPCIDQACSWNEFGGSWQVNEMEGLTIEFNDTGDPATCQYVFNGQLSAIDSVSGNVTAIVTFVTDGGYINIQYL